MKLTLFQKGALILLLPLIFQAVLAAALLSLQSQTEAEAMREAHAREVSDTINLIVRDSIDLSNSVQIDNFRKHTFDPVTYRMALMSVNHNLDRLGNLFKSNPDDLVEVERLKRSVSLLNALMDKVKATYRTGSDDAMEQSIRGTNPEIKSILKGMGATRLLSMAQEERDYLRRSPRVQEQYRAEARSWIEIALAVNGLFTILCIYMFSRGITGRIRVMRRNSLHLVRAEPLEPILRGSDELSELDKLFHKTIDAMRAAQHREQAIVENALDVICSIDSKLRFTVLNKASERVFGYPAEELAGARIVQIIAPHDIERTTEAIHSMTFEKEREIVLENCVRRKDGTLSDISWSLHWSAEENSIFCVARDITQEKKAERMKQSVVQMITHDLKSPLAAVHTFHELLELGVAGTLSEKGLNMLSAANNSTSRMLRLINDMLDLERLKAGMMTLERVHAPAEIIINNAIASIPQSQAYSRVETTIEPPNLQIFCDPDRIVQVIVNLLSNSQKFSPASKPINLSIRRKVDHVEIEVKDQGRGIPPEKLSTIFEPFTQSQSSDGTKLGGSGLGLAVCKAITELHGGTVTVESELDKGSTFRVTLAALT